MLYFEKIENKLQKINGYTIINNIENEEQIYFYNKKLCFMLDNNHVLIITENNIYYNEINIYNNLPIITNTYNLKDYFLFYKDNIHL